MQQKIYSLTICFFLCCATEESYCQLASDRPVKYDSSTIKTNRTTLQVLSDIPLKVKKIDLDKTLQQLALTDSLPSSAVTMPIKEPALLQEKKNK